MATEAQNISTPDWQMSADHVGEVLTGLADVRQCIHNILFTRKGEVPLNPSFGTTIHELIDKPLNKAIPSIVSEITDAITKYEPRVKLQAVSTSYSSGVARFEIAMILISSADKFQFTFDSGTIKNIQ